MKTTVKICCAVLVLGLVLTGAGYALGGQPLYHNEWHNGWFRFAGRFLPASMGDKLTDKINDRVNDTIDSALDHVWDGHGWDGHDWDDGDWDDHLPRASSASLDESVTGSVRKVDLELGRGTYVLVEADGDAAPFSVDCSEAIRLDSGFKDKDTWYVKARGNSKGTPITIYLPEGFSADKIDISVGAGELDAGTLRAREFELEVGAADVRIASLGFTEDADIEIGAGNAEIGLTETWGSYGYDMEAGLGDITVNGETIISGIGEVSRHGGRHLSAEVGAGSLSITTP